MSFSFSVFGNRYFFTPKFTLTTLLLLMVLLAFSIWQWQAAIESNNTINLINKRLLLDPIQTGDLEKGGDWRFYPIQMQGTFDNEHQILLSGRIYKNQQGFHVLTPFRPANSSKEILVNRGWLPGNPEQAPDINTATEGVTVTGVLFQPPSSFLFGTGFDEKNLHWPLLSSKLNLEKFNEILNNPIYPYVLLLSPSSPYGFVREWSLLSNTREPSQHVAFAKQWLALAFTVLLMFLLMNLHRE